MLFDLRLARTLGPAKEALCMPKPRHSANNDTLLHFAAMLGMACFQAQSLEASLVALFAVKRVADEGQWVPEVRALMDARYDQTLGRLVKDALAGLQLPPVLSLRLEEALKQRNWVVHRFYREYGASANSAALTKQATERLEQTWRFLERVAVEVNELAIKRQVNNSRSEDDIRRASAEAVDRYLSNREGGA